MIGAPKEAKRPINVTEYGVDAGGDNVFFGFRITETESSYFEVHHENLGELIRYLQKIAHEATQRRLKKPATEHLEVQGRPHNPVHTLDFQVEVSGQYAILEVTTKAGTSLHLQLEYKLVSDLHRELPSLLTEMEKRQQAAANKQ